MTFRILIGAVATVALLGAASSRLSAQIERGTEGVSGSSHSAAPTVRAVRIASEIKVDGSLTEAVWATAIPVRELTQLDPHEGAPISEPTEIRVLYDDEAIYIGAFLNDTGRVSTRLGRRDAFISDSDFFVVLLDSYHDHLTAFRFALNPSGVKRDELVSGGGNQGPGGGGGGDISWDPVWEGSTAYTRDGWTAEMRIPFSQLRFNPAAEQTWGIQFERSIVRKQERGYFAFTPKNERSGVARYGHLLGLEGIRSSKPLEVTPYAAARTEHRSISRNTNVGFANPFRSGSDQFGSAGIDLKYRVASNLTLSGTVNPDFGQVEVDPAVINLTAFETRFDEKRPFFVEGAEIFRFGGAMGGGGGPGGGGGGGGGGAGGGAGFSGEAGAGPPQLLYGRRIGRAPQGSSPDDAAYVDRPDATTIMSAVKLTGRTKGGWSVGVLEAVTDREEVAYVGNDGSERTVELEPLTNYFVGRLRRDVRAGQTTYGAMLTHVIRDLSDAKLAARLRSNAFAGGVDFRTDWADRRWSLEGYVSGSLIGGDTTVISSAQRSSARYYHRPDAAHVDFDSTVNRLQGLSARMELEKRAGTWLGALAVTTITPGYEINDLGFQSNADRISVDANLNYQENRPSQHFRRWNLRMNPELDWNYAGDRLKTAVGLNFNSQLASYWNVNTGITRQFTVLDDRLTRSGPLTRKPAGFNANANLFSDGRKKYGINASTNIGWDDAGASRISGNVGFTVRAAETWELRVSPNLSRSRTIAQYVTAIDDPTALHTFERRYVFAELEQHTLSLETRFNMTFRPSLSLEVYAQPFISSGDYEGFKELSQPGSFSFARYGQDRGTVARDADGSHVIDPDGAGPAASFTVSDRDFNLTSLRGNAVFRWEWRPGSTLFLVWQQNRSRQVSIYESDPDYDRIGSFSLGRDSRELFGLKPDNVFLVKLTYWFNP